MEILDLKLDQFPRGPQELGVLLAEFRYALCSVCVWAPCVCDPLCPICGILWSSRHYKATAHAHSFTDETKFVLGSHLNGIRGSLGSCRFPVDRKLANVVPVWKKSKKEDPENWEPLSLISVPGKNMEKMMLGVIEKSMKDNFVNGCSQHKLMSGRSCLI